MATATQPQLPLSGEPEDADGWRIDAHTREIGRRGLAEARAALAAAAARGEAREHAWRARRGHGEAA